MAEIEKPDTQSPNLGVWRCGGRRAGGGGRGVGVGGCLDGGKLGLNRSLEINYGLTDQWE